MPLGVFDMPHGVLDMLRGDLDMLRGDLTYRKGFYRGNATGQQSLSIKRTACAGEFHMKWDTAVSQQDKALPNGRQAVSLLSPAR